MKNRPCYPPLLLTLTATVALTALPACETGNRFGPSPTSMQSSFAPVSKMHGAFDRGDYPRAYNLASRAGDQPRHRHRFEAAYIAGLSALELKKFGPAEHYLRIAFQGTDEAKIRGDAGANLGMLYYHQGRYKRAAPTLLEAAQDLRAKSDRAQAYYHAARSEQNLGRMPSARIHYVRARGLTEDAQRRREINQRLKVTGYTIALGAFEGEEKAQQAADDLLERAKIDYSTKMVPASGQPSKTMVHLGEFSTYQSADKVRKRLGLGNALIVPLSQ